MANMLVRQGPRPGEFVCDPSAIRPSDRQRYQALRMRLRTALISSKTICNGFVMRLNEEMMSIEDVSEWIRMEGLCCPWLSLNVKRARARTLEVRITAPSRATEVLQIEFGELLP